MSFNVIIKYFEFKKISDFKQSFNFLIKLNEFNKQVYNYHFR